MPLTHFICPDGQQVEVQVCLSNCGCRLQKRCLTRSTLMSLGKQRKWTGVPSVTQLIKGTMEAFLLITENYAADPQEGAFALLGTTVHKNLEENEFGDSLAEGDLQYITKDGISMRPDLLETEDNWNILTDYKISGSFKIAKALGVYAVLEEDKTALYKQKTVTTNPETGEQITRLKGDPKLIKVWKKDIRRQDCLDWIRQANYYRVGINETGFPVNEMRIQALVRDGGLQIAQQRGLSDKIYMIPIPEISDDEIRAYFVQKKEALLKALEEKKCTQPCNDEENWNGRKCADYCLVADKCETGIMQKSQKTWTGELTW